MNAMKKHLLIKWAGSDERVEVELGLDPQPDEIRRTTVKYPDIARVFVAITTSTRTIETNKSQQITIHHSRKNYPKIVLEDPDLIRAFGLPENWFWGTATITISSDLDSATAKWQGTPPNPTYDGRCIILPKAPLEKTEREEVSRIKRRQDDFRDWLLIDRCCAITGEETQAALEAAHIVAAAGGGLEDPGNGILLRADIHRLYDAKLFEILPDGSIKITGTLSDPYRNILESAKVSDTIMGRIRKSLVRRTPPQ
jgi:hypothetical protein